MSDRRPDRLALLMFTLAALVAIVTVPAAIAVSRDSHAGTPAGTVRGFLVDTLDSDGFGACQYLGPSGVRAVRAMAQPNTDCEAVLPWARLRLGPDDVDTEAAVKALGFDVRESATRATVTVTAAGASHTFELRRATSAELDAYGAPPTPWRIDGGVATLLPRVSSAV